MFLASLTQSIESWLAKDYDMVKVNYKVADDCQSLSAIGAISLFTDDVTIEIDKKIDFNLYIKLS